MHSKIVSKFLQAGNTVKAEDIVELMYSSRDSAHKATRKVNVSTNDGPRPEDSGVDPIFISHPEKPLKIDYATAVHAKLTERAIQKVDKIVSKGYISIASSPGILSPTSRTAVVTNIAHLHNYTRFQFYIAPQCLLLCGRRS
jgi:hypothetical protein